MERVTITLEQEDLAIARPVNHKIWPPTYISDRREEAMDWKGMHGCFLTRRPPHQSECGVWWCCQVACPCSPLFQQRAVHVFPLVKANGVSLVCFYLLFARFHQTMVQPLIGPATGQRDDWYGSESSDLISHKHKGVRLKPSHRKDQAEHGFCKLQTGREKGLPAHHEDQCSFCMQLMREMGWKRNLHASGRMHPACVCMHGRAQYKLL
jgi:hypothetical protein